MVYGESNNSSATNSKVRTYRQRCTSGVGRVRPFLWSGDFVVESRDAIRGAELFQKLGQQGVD